MKVRFLNRSSKWENSAIFCLLLALAGTLCVCPQSRAGQSSTASAMVDDPMSQIHWAAGPQRITLGDFAYIDIPQGYRLTDVLGARKFLGSQNDSVPGDTVGILASTSGNWWAVLEYNTKGYIKDAGAQPIDSAAVLKDVQAQIQSKNNVGSAATSVDWDKTPVYDAQANSLAWSLKVQNGSAQAVNQTIALLGRYGVFQITAVQTSSLDKGPSLADLASNVSFRDGDRYADYQIGDKVAEIGLAQLIAGEKHTAVAASNVSGGTVMVFVYATLAVGIVAGSVLLLRKKNRQENRSDTAKVAAPAAQAAPAPVQAAAQPQPAVAAPVSAQPVANGHGLVAAKVATNGHATKHLHRSRKKVFNYPKFYTNVMRELSLHSYGPAIGMNGHKNGRNGHANGANGHKNGHANGNGNGHTNGHSNGSNGSNGNGSSVNESLKSEIVELIATQKNLIQEQKTLLEEQTRLIEQKRWLIEEQTAFLKGQAENQFPLKFE